MMLTSFLALGAGSNQWDKPGDRHNVLEQRLTVEDPRQVQRDTTLVGKLTIDCDCNIEVLFDSFYDILLK